MCNLAIAVGTFMLALPLDIENVLGLLKSGSIAAGLGNYLYIYGSHLRPAATFIRANFKTQILLAIKNCRGTMLQLSWLDSLRLSISTEWLEKKKPANAVQRRATVQTRVIRGDDKNFRRPLSFLDNVSSFLWVSILYNFDALIDPDVLSAGLKLALEEYPEAGGRLISKGTPAICGNEGISFSVVERTDKPPSIDAPAHALVRSGFLPSSRSYGIPSSVVQLNLFRADNRSILGVSASHALGDGHTMFSFLSKWSRHCESIALGASSFENDGRHYTGNQHRFEQPEIPSPSDICKLKPSLGASLRSVIARGVSMSSFAWKLFRSRPLELRIEKKFLADLKNACLENLKRRSSETQWLSTYEVFLALWVRILNASREKREPVEISVVVNLRNRMALYPASFIGNAFTTTPPAKLNSLKVREDEGILTSIELAAAEVHENIRSFLKHGDDMYDFQWYQAAYSLGFSARAFHKYLLPSYLGNSWTSFDCLSLKMGTHMESTRMWCTFRHSSDSGNFIPRDSAGGLTLNTHLPKKQIDRIVEIITKESLPIEVFTDA